MDRVSIFNIILGSILLGTVIIFNISDIAGFALFLIGSFLVISGIILNKKIKALIVDFFINFF